MPDGCADVGGCLEAPFAIFELMKNPKEALVILGVAGLVLGGIVVSQPEPPPPKPGFFESVKDDFVRARNRRKIEKAEREYWEKQRQQALPASSEPDDVAPVDSGTRWGRAKDWLRDKLNEDYDQRHGEDR